MIKYREQVVLELEKLSIQSNSTGSGNISLKDDPDVTIWFDHDGISAGSGPILALVVEDKSSPREPWRHYDEMEVRLPCERSDWMHDFKWPYETPKKTAIRIQKFLRDLRNGGDYNANYNASL